MLSGLVDTIIFITSFLFVLSFLVFFHEWGHYSVARFFNVAVERFSIGFGKPIAEWTAKSGTKWSIGNIPLGGYVKFLGDAGAASNPDAEALEKLKTEVELKNSISIEEIFHFKPVWQRALIVLAGPVANFILAIVLFAILALSFGTRNTDSIIGEISPNSAAEAAGFEIGDKVLTMDGRDVSDYNNMFQYVALRAETPIKTIVERDGRKVELIVTPKRITEKDSVGGDSSRGQIGVRRAPEGMIAAKTYNPATALAFGAEQTGKTLSMTGTYIKRIFQGREDGKQLGSIVKIATITGKSTVDAAKADVPFKRRMRLIFATILSIAASLSIALGFANLMPIPALDGGHLVYYSYEALAGRPLSQKKQEFGFRIGFAILLTLFVILTVNDIGYVVSIFS